MINLGSIFNTIRKRVTLISLAPVFVVTILLISFTVTERFSDLESASDQLGSSSANYIAATAEISMFAGDQSGLDTIAENALKIPSVTGLIFIGTDLNHISSYGTASIININDLNDCLEQGYSFHYNNSHNSNYYCHRISSSTTDVSDYAEETSSDLETNWYGWVLLVLSTNDIQVQQRSILLVSIAVAIAGMIASMLLALFIGRGISKPVQRLTETVKKLESGDLNVDADIGGPIETQILAKGINQLANSVRESQTTLEEKINAATSALDQTLNHFAEQNHQLKKTRDELQQAIKTKDHFLARMSHEMRTPLTTVIGYSQLLNNSTLDTDQMEYSNNIAHASSLLLATIDDVLDFSKMQSNALVLENIRLNLRDCFESLVVLHAPNAHQKSLELVLLIDSDVPKTLLGDPMRLSQILNNLLANAIKFTHQGEVVVRVSLKSLTADIIKLHFQIRDSGIGIDGDQLKRLFKPFSQADESTTRLYGGSGLGLIICKQLIDLMQGEIYIQSIIDQGTEINFCIPFDIDTNQDQDLPTMIDSDFHLLAYDSNAWARRAIRTQLTRQGCHAFTPSTSAQFTHLLHDDQLNFDLIILGLNSYEINPISLSERLANLRIHYQGPILLLACTPNVQSTMPKHILSDYAPIYYLSKPTKQEALINMLHIISGKVAENQHSKTSPTSHPLCGCEILVVEDNNYNRKLIRTVVEHYGATVHEATNGQQAVDHFLKQGADLILMDVHMPIMDGIQATRIIIQHADEHGIPIIALTANVIENEDQAMFEAGALDILYKPLDEQKLIATICEHLGYQYPVATIKSQGILKPDESTLAALKEELSRLIAGIRSNHQAQDTAAMREKIHELLGLAGLFGMDNLKIAVTELRNQPTTTPPKDYSTLLDDIQNEITAL